jgi:hypothetical protein
VVQKVIAQEQLLFAFMSHCASGPSNLFQGKILHWTAIAERHKHKPMMANQNGGKFRNQWGSVSHDAHRDKERKRTITTTAKTF